MHECREDLLQFVWQHQLLKPATLKTVSGKMLTVLKPGDLNRDAGPDFFNARIQLEDVILAGNIELHVKSSDWLKHKHQHNKSYDNLVLHVVYEHDAELQQNIIHNVEVLQIKYLLPEGLVKNYSDIINARQTLACGNQLKSVTDIKFSSWLQRMYVERLEKKTAYINALFDSYQGDYLQTFYTVLLRNFGFKVNALPFELLSKHLPVNILLKHADNLLQLEALLLGTAGLLDELFSDPYVLKLQNEFEYLRAKYQLIPLKKELFKFSKLRPANFATLRLAQFAQIVYRRPALFHSPQAFQSFEKINACFKISLEGYWLHHYHLGGEKTEKELTFGQQSVTNIVINTFANFFFFYGRRTCNSALEVLPFGLLEACPFENNSKTKLFLQKKHQLKNASDSQALIHLHDEYCTKRKCLSCAVAVSILNTPV